PPPSPSHHNPAARSSGRRHPPDNRRNCRGKAWIVDGGLQHVARAREIFDDRRDRRFFHKGSPAAESGGTWPAPTNLSSANHSAGEAPTKRRARFSWTGRGRLPRLPDRHTPPATPRPRGRP